MSDITTTLPPNAESFVREELNSVWRQQLDRLHQVVNAWPLEIERTLEGTRADLIARIEHRYRAVLQEWIEEAARKARKEVATELIGSLNQSVRRLASAENDEQWREMLLDAAQVFCDRAALFTVNNGQLELESTRNIQSERQLSGVPLDSAPAFGAAIETRDTIIAMRSKGEMSPSIAQYFGEAENDKFHLFPVISRGRLATLLYADGGSAQVESLELLATVAGAILEGRSSVSARKGDLINIASARKTPEGHSWSALSEEDRELHRKAQRFARVQVASIRLYKSDAVKNGRTGGQLYTSLKEEIDAARGVFRRDFIAKSETMVDYLHLELVGTLANDDVELLGPDYPGPLA
jgi:hypothetical protein